MDYIISRTLNYNKIIITNLVSNQVISTDLQLYCNWFTHTHVWVLIQLVMQYTIKQYYISCNYQCMIGLTSVLRGCYCFNMCSVALYINVLCTFCLLLIFTTKFKLPFVVSDASTNEWSEIYGGNVMSLCTSVLFDMLNSKITQCR